MSIIRSITMIVLIVFAWIPLFSRQKPVKHYTIMLDPAGDARHTGRTISDSFERALTYNIAQLLQQKLEISAPVTVIITRSPGEIVYPMQNSTFANRIPINLYLTLHCYQNQQEKHTIALFTFSHGDTFMTTSSDLEFIPINKAHWQNAPKTTTIAQKLYNTLNNQHSHQLQILPVATIPIAPLIGIQAPAIGIEMNCLSTQDSKIYADALAKSIITVLEP